MGSVSIWHWIVVIVFLILFAASPIMGIVRGVRNSSVLNALLSHFIPAYGLIYFFAGRR
jgi:choline-glycine betaine transporter